MNLRSGDCGVCWGSSSKLVSSCVVVFPLLLSGELETWGVCELAGVDEENHCAGDSEKDLGLLTIVVYLGVF